MNAKRPKVCKACLTLNYATKYAMTMLKTSIYKFLLKKCIKLYIKSFEEHVTPVGHVPEWWLGEALPYMDGRREIKYLPRTNMHAASVLIVSGCKQRLSFK